MMESIEKLREAFEKCTHPIKDELIELDTVWIPRVIAMAMLDEIEAEIEREYMKLPVDTDGVPIRVGDKLECDANGYEGTFTVFAIGNDTVVGNHEIEWIKDNPDKWFHVAKYCHHIKPRTLEDVLDDYAKDVYKHGRDVNDVEKYAAEIRELLGGDA